LPVATASSNNYNMAMEMQLAKLYENNG